MDLSRSARPLLWNIPRPASKGTCAAGSRSSHHPANAGGDLFESCYTASLQELHHFKTSLQRHHFKASLQKRQIAQFDCFINTSGHSKSKADRDPAAAVRLTAAHMCIISFGMKLNLVTAFICVASTLSSIHYCPAVWATTVSQIQSGTIRGTVTDTTGAALPAARIMLDNSLTGFQSQTSSDGQGAFVFENLGFDSYRLRVTAGGFESFAQSVSVRSNIPVVIGIKLVAAGIS